MPIQIERRFFSVEEYHRMAEAGILLEDDQVELIEGVVRMSPIGRRHAACVNRLNAIFNHRGRQAALVSVQNPIRLDDHSEPEPDLLLLKPRRDFYDQSLPVPADVLLLVEVADTSGDYDREVKLPLYAQAGIPEVWLVHLGEEVVEVCVQPANGAYRQSRLARRGDTLIPENMPTLSVGVAEIFGQEPSEGTFAEKAL